MEKKNRIWKKFAVILMTVFSLSLLSPEMAADLGVVQTVQAAVKLNAKSVKLVKGQKKTLKLTGTKKKVSWSSNKKSVATVSSKGVVTAKKKGTAVITAKVGNKKYTCKVTVSEKTIAASTAGFRKLIAYIQNNGETNSDGNKYINNVDYDYDTATAYAAGIIYDASKDVLNFVLADRNQAETEESAVVVTVPKALKSAPVYYAYVYKDGESYGAVELNAVVNMATYKDGSKIAFQIKNNTSVGTATQVNELGNSYLRLGFLYWKELLQNGPRMTMKELGFTAYK